jgi:diguanylate cyclase (GGDEF)-like protein
MGLDVKSENQTAVPLQLLAENEIKQNGFRLRFPEALERGYRRDTSTGRAHELRVVSAIALAVFLAMSILLKLCVDTDSRGTLSLSCWGVVTGAMLLAQTCFRPAVPALHREAAMFGFCVALYLSVIAIVGAQPAPLLLESLVLATLPINFILIVVRLPFPLTVLFAASAGIAYVGGLLIHSDISRAETVFLIAFLLASTLPTLLAVHWLERGGRHLYLHGLLKRLNYERVVTDNAVLTDPSYTDPLTGVANRRRLDGELQRLCDKEDTCATFLMVDLDWFKGFNDRYGHLMGDRCLQEVAICLGSALRDGDLLARLGGEEFGVLLPTLPMQEAVLVAERLRAAVAAYPFMVGTRVVRISVSIGVASIVGFDEPKRVIDAADKAMYRAKRAGRNRVGGPWMKLAS